MYILFLTFFLLSFESLSVDDEICKPLTEESMQFINENYAEGIHEDGRQVYEAWSETLTHLGRFLSDRGFQWETEHRIFLYFCFSPDGTIEYIFYSIPGDKPFHNEEEFRKYTSEFAETWVFPLQADIRFAQCGTAVFTPVSR